MHWVQKSYEIETFIYYAHLKTGDSTFKYLKEVFHSIFWITRTIAWCLHFLCRIITLVQSVEERQGLWQKVTAEKQFEIVEIWEF
jgi:hypothetical protein